MGLRINAARNGEPHKFQRRTAVLASLEIASGRYFASLHRANTGLDVQLCGECLRWTVILIYVWQKSFGIEKYCMRSDWLDNWDTGTIEFLAQVTHLTDTSRLMFFCNCLPNALGHSLHVSPREAAMVCKPS